MANIPISRTSRSSILPMGSDGDGNQIGNLILRNLPRKECALLVSSLEFVRLRPRQILHKAGDAIRSVYFLNQGIGAVLIVQPDGKSVEVGLVGREGFVGLPVIFGFKSSGLRIVTQADATAYRMDTQVLLKALPQCPVLELQLQRYSMILGMQTTQLAACNRLHNVIERLARWLLMTQDLVDSKTMPMTHEFLGQMLGTRRAGVSEAAGQLQQAGTISYTRGSVTVLNRAKLEHSACNCYGIIQEQKERWLQETQ
jgi:CRP-like cAMP-binding protein